MSTGTVLDAVASGFGELIKAAIPHLLDLFTKHGGNTAAAIAEMESKYRVEEVRIDAAILAKHAAGVGGSGGVDE